MCGVGGMEVPWVALKTDGTVSAQGRMGQNSSHKGFLADDALHLRLKHAVPCLDHVALRRGGECAKPPRRHERPYGGRVRPD